MSSWKIGTQMSVEAERAAVAPTLDLVEVLEIDPIPFCPFPHQLSRSYRSPSEWEKQGALVSKRPVVFHAVAYNFLGPAPIDEIHWLPHVAHLARMMGAPWYSDHLHYSAADAISGMSDPEYSRPELDRLVERLNRVQDRLGRPLGIENSASRFPAPGNTLPQAEFVAELIERTGCFLLLDLHNAFCEFVNYGLPLQKYLDTIPLRAVREVHLAGGHLPEGDVYYNDSHVANTPDYVFDLFEHLAPRLSGLELVIMEYNPAAKPPAQLDAAALRRDLARLHAIRDRVGAGARLPAPAPLQPTGAVLDPAKMGAAGVLTRLPTQRSGPDVREGASPSVPTIARFHDVVARLLREPAARDAIRRRDAEALTAQFGLDPGEATYWVDRPEWLRRLEPSDAAWRFMVWIPISWYFARVFVRTALVLSQAQREAFAVEYGDRFFPFVHASTFAEGYRVGAALRDFVQRERPDAPCLESLVDFELGGLQVLERTRSLSADAWPAPAAPGSTGLAFPRAHPSLVQLELGHDLTPILVEGPEVATKVPPAGEPWRVGVWLSGPAQEDCEVVSLSAAQAGLLSLADGASTVAALLQTAKASAEDLANLVEAGLFV